MTWGRSNFIYYVPQATSPAEDVTADKWFPGVVPAPKAALPKRHSPAGAWSTHTPAPPPETITPDKWMPGGIERIVPRARLQLRQLSPPAYAKPPASQETVLPDSWYQQALRPPRRDVLELRRTLPFGYAKPPAHQETVLADTWFPAPVRLPIRRALRLQQLLAVFGPPWFLETSPDRWQPAQPQAPRAARRTVLAADPFAPFVEPPAEEVTLDKWINAQLPVPRRAGRAVAAEALVWTPFQPTPGPDSWWFQPIAARMRRPAWSPQPYAPYVEQPVVVTIDSWFVPPAIAGRRGRWTPVSLQTVLHPPVAPADSWLPAQPVVPKRRRAVPHFIHAQCHFVPTFADAWWQQPPVKPKARARGRVQVPPFVGLPPPAPVITVGNWFPAPLPIPRRARSITRWQWQPFWTAQPVLVLPTDISIDVAVPAIAIDRPRGMIDNSMQRSEVGYLPPNIRVELAPPGVELRIEEDDS